MKDVCLQHSIQKVSAANQRQGMTEESYRTCQSCLMNSRKPERLDLEEPRVGDKVSVSSEPIRLTAAAISDAHANSVKKIPQIVPSNGKPPPKAPKPFPPPKPMKPSSQPSPQVESLIHSPPRDDVKDTVSNMRSVIPPPHVPAHVATKSEIKQGNIDHLKSPPESFDRVKGMETSEAENERKQSYDCSPRSTEHSPTNTAKKVLCPTASSNESQLHLKGAFDCYNSHKKTESSTKFPSELYDNKIAVKEHSILTGANSSHVPIASQLFREKVEATNKKSTSPPPTPLPTPTPTPVASQLFREKVEAMNKKSTSPIPPPTPAPILTPILTPIAMPINIPAKQPVQDIPQSHSSQCNIVFGIPDEVQPFNRDDPLQGSLSNQSMSVIRAGSPLKSVIPTSSSHYYQKVCHTKSATETSSTFNKSVSGGSGVIVSTAGSVPVRADTIIPIKYGSNEASPSQSHSPRATPSSSHSINKMKPISSSLAIKGPPMNKSSSASSLSKGPEMQSSASCTTSGLKNHNPKVSKVTSQYNSNSKINNSVDKVSSVRINDYITSQAKSPSKNLKTSSYSETKNGTDSGSMESTSSHTTVESKISTTTVTYEYECDIDDNDNQEDEYSSAIQDNQKNKLQQLKQKRPERFCEKDVRKKMEEDGVPPDVMFEFLKTIGTPLVSESNIVHRDTSAGRPGQIRQNSAPNLTQVPHPKGTKKEIESFIPPPPVSLPQSPKVHDTFLSKYVAYNKMRAMKIPDGAVRQKMVTDGISVKEINAYFNDNVAKNDSAEVQGKISPPPPPPPPPPPHMMLPPPAPTPIVIGVELGKNLSTNTLPQLEGRSTVKIPTSGKLPSRDADDVINFKLPPEISVLCHDLQNPSHAKECTSPVQNESVPVNPAIPVNPATSVFASIRSGVTLKALSSSQIEYESIRKPTPPLTKKPASMHDMLISALSSRRLCSNMEITKTTSNDSNDASDNEFDLFE